MYLFHPMQQGRIGAEILTNFPGMIYSKEKAGGKRMHAAGKGRKK